MKKEIGINYSEGEGLEKIEYRGKVVIKRLKFSEKNELEEESTEIKLFGNMPQTKISTSRLKELGILKSVSDYDLVKTTYKEDKVTKQPIAVSTPYYLDINGIRDLPIDVGEILFYEFTEMNTLGSKKKKT